MNSGLLEVDPNGDDGILGRAAEAASTRSTVDEWLEAVDLAVPQRSILARVSDPFPTPPCTLDAVHLATMLVWRERMKQALVLATHDTGLALAARSFGIEVLGVGLT